MRIRILFLIMIRSFICLKSHVLIKVGCPGILFVYGEFLNVINFDTVLKQLLSKPVPSGLRRKAEQLSLHSVCFSEAEFPPAKIQGK